MESEVDAVILAGGINRIPLYPGNRPGSKALVEVGDRPLLAYSLEAARDAETVRRIIVVGPAPVCSEAWRRVECREIVAEESLLANIRDGMAEVETERALYLTADVPLLRAGMLDDFVRRAAESRADLCASVVNRLRFAPFAETKKPFIRFADGEFTHGNLFMIPRESLEHADLWSPLDRLYAARKSAVKTVARVGPGLLLWFLFDVLLLHRPTLSAAAARVSRALGVEIEPVESPHPEIALDVDEPEDYALAQRALSSDSA